MTCSNDFSFVQQPVNCQRTQNDLRYHWKLIQFKIIIDVGRHIIILVPLAPGFLCPVFYIVDHFEVIL